MLQRYRAADSATARLDVADLVYASEGAFPLITFLRYPILHFVLIGGVLFGVSELWTSSAPERTPAAREPIVFSRERIQGMQADFFRRWGTAPTPEALSALIAQAVEDEMLYREARMLALDYEDSSVRRRLVEKMRVLSERPGRRPDVLVREARALGLDDDIVIRRLLIEKMRLLLAQDPTAAPLTETELRDYLERHRERFERPAEVTFSHVFLSADAHGSELEKDALTALSHVRSLSPSAALELSDPFLLGLRLHAYSKSRVMARLGKPFAEQVFALRPGEWSSPIASPYGLHLVRVEEKSAPRLPELAAVRRQIAEGVRTERAAVQLAQGIARVRRLYEIRVDGRENLSTPGTLASRP